MDAFRFTRNGTCRTIDLLARRIGLSRDGTRAPMQVRNGWRPSGRRSNQPAAPSKNGRFFVQPMGSTSQLSFNCSGDTYISGAMARSQHSKSILGKAYVSASILSARSRRAPAAVTPKPARSAWPSGPITAMILSSFRSSTTNSPGKSGVSGTGGRLNSMTMFPVYTRALRCGPPPQHFHPRKSSPASTRSFLPAGKRLQPAIEISYPPVIGTTQNTLQFLSSAPKISTIYINRLAA